MNWSLGWLRVSYVNWSSILSTLSRCRFKRNRGAVLSGCAMSCGLAMCKCSDLSMLCPDTPCMFLSRAFSLAYVSALRPLNHSRRSKGPRLSPFQMLSKNLRESGFLSLYRGLPSPLLGSMVENSVLFSSYGKSGDDSRDTTRDPACSSPALALRKPQEPTRCCA
jgi:hypothetical protein